MERQLLDGVGAGIRYLAVEHEERSQSSPEEAARIAEESERLVGRRYTPPPMAETTFAART
jgi:hypothetical protein